MSFNPFALNELLLQNISIMRFPALLSLPLCCFLSHADTCFFYALDQDIKAFNTLGHPIGDPVRLGSTNIQRLQLGPHNIYAARMGSGALETALHAQNLFSRFPCTRAFSIGPAGALDQNLSPGTWHPVSSVVGWQVGSWGPAGFVLNPKATLSLGCSAGPLGGTNPALVLASGDAFIASHAQGQVIRSLAGADLIDMNLYGLARACAERSIPLQAWKIVSDHANADASSDFQHFLRDYDGEGGKALATWLMQQPLSADQPEAHPRIERLLRPDK